MVTDSIREFTQRQQREAFLADAIGLPELSSGWHTIRDHRGWREDEQSIEYVWIVTMDRHFVGRGGLITVRFNEHAFRGKKHPEELVQGVFRIGANDQIQEFYQERANIQADQVLDCFQLDLFNANKGITLDGISYEIHIMAPYIDTIVRVGNPVTPQWRIWEAELEKLAGRLTSHSGSIDLIKLFS